MKSGVGWFVWKVTTEWTTSCRLPICNISLKHIQKQTKRTSEYEGSRLVCSCAPLSSQTQRNAKVKKSQQDFRF